MGAFSRRAVRLGVVATLIATGWVVTSAPSDAGKRPAPKPFVRHWSYAAKRPPISDSFSSPQTPQPSVQYWGGPVLRTNETFVVFWDPNGQLSQSYRDLVVRYFQDVAADHGDDV